MIVRYPGLRRVLVRPYNTLFREYAILVITNPPLPGFLRHRPQPNRNQIAPNRTEINSIPTRKTKTVATSTKSSSTATAAVIAAIAANAMFAGI